MTRIYSAYGANGAPRRRPKGPRTPPGVPRDCHDGVQPPPRFCLEARSLRSRATLQPVHVNLFEVLFPSRNFVPPCRGLPISSNSNLQNCNSKKLSRIRQPPSNLFLNFLFLQFQFLQISPGTPLEPYKKPYPLSIIILPCIQIYRHHRCYHRIGSLFRTNLTSFILSSCMNLA